jgi:hypothetical protein
MPTREAKAIAKGCRWLLRVHVPHDDLDRHILRLFALAVSRAPSYQLQRCSRLIPAFTWFHYRGDPLPALVGDCALKAAGHSHPGLAELREGYRSLLTDQATSLPLLYRLLELKGSLPSPVTSASALDLITAPRDRVLEFCRDITMSSCAGTSVTTIGLAEEVLPRLAFSYARDWDIEVACSLLRACVYLCCDHATACRWTLEWLLDQQQTDGRFGLLLAEAEKCGWKIGDGTAHFDRTVHALWALAELTHIGGLRIAE